MDRPTNFEEYRYIGDRRRQVVYDVDEIVDPSVIEELLAVTHDDALNGPAFTCFSPDTLAEARNRGYRPWKGDGSGRPDTGDGDEG